MTTTLDETLAHFGIKGMRWGVRRSSSQLHNASQDHTNATSARAKARKGGTASLTNQEIQDIITRTNLEQQFSKISPSKLAKGRAAVKAILATGKTVNDVVSFVNSPAGKIVKQKLTRG